MGAGASWNDDRRYMNGMRPDEFWDQIAWPENEETMEILQFTKHQGFTIFQAFVNIDIDNGGEVSVDEFHQFLGMPQTKFSERVFGILDTDGSGALDFNEFVVGVWNYCTYDERLMTKLAFDIFDIDRLGKMDIYECDALLRMVYDVERLDEIQGPPSGKEILQQMDVNGDGDVTIDEFSDLIESHTYIMAPAFDLQRALRQRLLGIKFWERETSLRQVMFANYDTLDKTSAESVRQILEVKKKALEEQAAAEEEKIKIEEREEAEHLQEVANESLAERQARRKRKMQRLQKRELEEERREKEAVVRLKEAKAVMDVDVPYRVEDVESRQAARRELYSALDALNTAIVEAREARATKYKAHIVAEDAETKLKEYLQTKEGQKRLKFDMRVRFGEDMYTNYKDGSAVAAAIAPLYKAPVEDTATTMSIMTMALSREKTLAQYRERVQRQLLNEFKGLCQNDFEDNQKKEKRKQEKSFKKMFDDFVGDYGTVTTKWERFLDQASGSVYWFNFETGATEWTKPAICHKCDRFIDPVDVRCFQCNTDRTEANLRLYNGLSADVLKKDLDKEEEREEGL